LVQGGIPTTIPAFVKPIRFEGKRHTSPVNVYVSGIMHSRFVCVFLLFGAQLIGFIPLAALACVLVVVSWNMIEKGLLVALLRNWRSALVLMITFGLTVAINLTTGILAGCLASIVLQWKKPRPASDAFEN
jgi:SulP family sulfate permease